MYSLLIQEQNKSYHIYSILDCTAVTSIAKMNQKNHNIIQAEDKSHRATLLLLLRFQTSWSFFTGQ